MSSNPKWDDERTETLKSIVGTTSPVTTELVTKAAESLDANVRSVSAKLRNLGYDVESMAKVRGKSYT